jgi:hypothetical protein
MYAPAQSKVGIRVRGTDNVTLTENAPVINMDPNSNMLHTNNKTVHIEVDVLPDSTSMITEVKLKVLSSTSDALMAPLLNVNEQNTVMMQQSMTSTTTYVADNVMVTPQLNPTDYNNWIVVWVTSVEAGSALFYQHRRPAFAPGQPPSTSNTNGWKIQSVQ